MSRRCFRNLHVQHVHHVEHEFCYNLLHWPLQVNLKVDEQYTRHSLWSGPMISGKQSVPFVVSNSSRQKHPSNTPAGSKATSPNCPGSLERPEALPKSALDCAEIGGILPFPWRGGGARAPARSWRISKRAGGVSLTVGMGIRRAAMRVSTSPSPLTPHPLWFPACGRAGSNFLSVYDSLQR